MARSSRAKSSARPINWPLAVGIGGVAALGAWYWAAQRAAASRLAAAPPNPVLNPPAPGPAPAPTGSRPAAPSTVTSIQTALNALSGGGNACPRIAVDGAWGTETFGAVQCWYRLVQAMGQQYNVPLGARGAAMTEANAQLILAAIRANTPSFRATYAVP